MKPIARWTFGKSSMLGIETLRQSVRRFRKLYPEFDLIVCHNNLTIGQKDLLLQLGVPLHEQKTNELKYELMNVDSPPGWKSAAPGWGWKLAPPRLRFSSHELWIDNDIVILERLPSIDIWLNSSRSIISTAHQRAYGIFDDSIKEGLVCSAGFFGLPPGYDFENRIYHFCQKLNGKPLGYYDEQGVTVSCVLECDPVIVPYDELTTVKELTKPFAKGLHFIGVNRTEHHENWEKYKCCILM
jgi:hypothetical protein